MLISNLMGNTCTGPNLGTNGFLQSVMAAVTRNRPPDDCLTPPNSNQETNGTNNLQNTEGSSKARTEPDPPNNNQSFDASSIAKGNSAQPNSNSNSNSISVQSTPPETVKINSNEIHEANKNQQVHNGDNKNDNKGSTDDNGKSKKVGAHMKRLSSAGLQIESVLGRKTENIKDRFSLGRKLGQGQFGTTYLCIEKETGKEFACKTIAKRKLTTQEDVEDVRREIRIMHHLAGHPNVIQIVGSYEDAVAVHLVMELCAGGELFDRIIQRGHYTERKAAQLARIIVGVLEACHSLGVMHRDLKPENFLFVDHEEEAPLKTIDFGLSMFFRPGKYTSN